MASPSPSPDPATQSNYLEITTKHIDIVWSIDWDHQILTGAVTHTLVAQKSNVNQVVFDTSFLKVVDVSVDGDEVDFSLGPRHTVMGSALTIRLPNPSEMDKSVKVHISYSTTAQCTALGWLDKEQTAGKEHPYLYSQCQAIHARSLLPVQDTPAVKVTYTASVTSVLPALLSARRLSPPSDIIHGGKRIGVDEVVYKYDQPIAIPSYLIAIASGNLVYRAFESLPHKSWQTGVWTEPELMEAAYWEFSKDTANYVAKAEELAGPYEFGVYDLLILPPSFPFGGMENANLTFVTPTLLAGDRSLVDVVAHEISHSWFGNNVGCASWSSFWLNEGWTTYCERLLQQALHGPAARDFSYIIGRKALADDLKEFAEHPKYQRLHIPYDQGEDPDDAFSRVPYDKGSNFLLYIERALGGLDVFLPYMKEYVITFRGKAISTADWKAHLYQYFRLHHEEKLLTLDAIDWKAWLDGEGLQLPVENVYDTTLALKAFQLAERWDTSRTVDAAKLDFGPEDIKDLDSNQKVAFLEKLASFEPLPASHIKALHDTYSLGKASAEIALRFYQLALASQSYFQEAADWVVGAKQFGTIKGRMKFCRPVFKALFTVDPELAIRTWTANRKYFHPIAKGMIDKDLGITLVKASEDL